MSQLADGVRHAAAHLMAGRDGDERLADAARYAAEPLGCAWLPLLLLLVSSLVGCAPLRYAPGRDRGAIGLRARMAEEEGGVDDA